MPGVRWGPLILCIWLTLFHVSADNTSDLLASPTRWELPSPLEWSVALVDPIEADNITILFRVQNKDLNGSKIKFTTGRTLGGSHQCYIEINHIELQSHAQLSIDKTELMPSIDLNPAVNINHVRLICPNVILERPQDPMYLTEVQAVVQIASQNGYIPGQNELDFSPISFNITDAPTFLHQYTWNANQPSMVSVTFTFYRPTAMENQHSFAFKHPLLDFSTITSLHSSDDSAVNDLGRLYNLIGYLSTESPHTSLKCNHVSPSESSEIIFTRTSDGTGYDVLTHVKLPANAPSLGYRCTFTLDYPADVIHSILQRSNPDDNPVSFDISIEGEPSAITVKIPIPHEIYDQRPAGGPSPKALHWWHSPHHSHDLYDTFEFGIAMTDRYVPDALTRDDIQLVVPNRQPNALTFDIGVVGDLTIYPFEDWQPEIVCRDHGEPGPNDYTHTPIQDGRMLLELGFFSGLGKTCRLRLTTTPTGVSGDAILRMSVNVYTDEDISYGSSFPLINVFHKYNNSLRPLFLNTKDVVNIDNLPPPLPIPFTIQPGEDPNTDFLMIDMELQYLLPSPLLMDVASEMYISLIFVNAQGPLQVLQNGNPPKVKVTMTSRGRVVVNEDNISIQIPNGEMYPSPFPLVDGDDPLQHNYPIRSPQFHIRYPTSSTILEATQPLRVSIQIPVAPDFDGGDAMYAMLAPALYSNLSVYSGEFARITPVRTPPLTGYSYRCVSWDKMAAPYVYGGAEQLTEMNSYVCPTFPQSGENLDPALWRQTTYSPNGAPRCMYELATVCVTRSKTNPSAYDAHPLADCPSFLGGVHAIPCSLVEDEPPTWNYKVVDLTSRLSEPELDGDNVHQKRSLTLSWSYIGDPRLSVAVAVKAQLKNPEDDGNDDDNDDDENNNGNQNDQHGWITLVRDIPAYFLSLSHQGELTIGFPILNPAMKGVSIRLTLNGVSGVGQTITIPHTMAEDQWDSDLSGCKENQYKLFDDVTHLCKCQEGYIPSNPTSVDNPLVHPSEFTCESKPFDDVPSTSELCHTIPNGVEPPYFTLNCGFGFAVNTNGKCDECTCFKAWTKGTNDDKNDGNKCERCLLKDVCVVDNTADITFTPEYCLVKRCLCEPGYSGDKCQYTVMYGTLAYHDVATEEQKASLANASKESPVIVSRRQITAFHPRVTNNVKASLGDTPVEIFVQQATQVLSEDGEEVITSIMVALGRLTSADASPSPSPFIMAASPFTLTSGDGSNSNDLGDLHYAWEQLQNNYQDRPVYKDDDYGTLNGGVGSAYDPHCVPNAYTYCPDGGKDDLLPPESQVDDDELQDVYQEPPSTDHTTTYIIIGVVVGVVLLLFIALIVSVLYCRKHEKMCFRKRKTKGGVSSSKTTSHHASSTAGLELTSASSHSSAPASAPPSATLSTSSYLPTQVAVDDPTLPADWIALRDQNTGNVYYSNKVTMESSWDHPAQPKEKPKSAYGW